MKWELAQNIIKQDNNIYNKLGEYTSESFARDITPDFMKAQDLKWVTRMYTFLRTAAPKLWKLTDKDSNKLASSLPFREAPIIKTQKGEWVKPFVDVTSPNIYLPLRMTINPIIILLLMSIYRTKWLKSSLWNLI